MKRKKKQQLVVQQPNEPNAMELCPTSGEKEVTVKRKNIHQTQNDVAV